MGWQRGACSSGMRPGRIILLIALLLPFTASVDASASSTSTKVVVGRIATTSQYGPVPRSAPTTPRVTPARFGAKGDGRTDDTTAMQEALKAAAGKTLWLPANRTYLISRTIAVPSNTAVVGAGPTSILKFNWRRVESAGSGGGSNLRSAGTSARNIRLSNFVLEGAGDGYPAGAKKDNRKGLVPMLKLILVDGFSVMNMELRNAAGLSISYTGSRNGVFRNNYVHHSGRDGITGYRNTRRNVTDIVVDSNLIEKVGDDAIAINGLVPGHDLRAPRDGSRALPHRIRITNNVLRGWRKNHNGQNLGRGIALNGVAGVLVASNRISRPNGTGILLTGCNPHICRGSSTLWRSTKARLLGNTIFRATGGSRPGAIAIIRTRRSVVQANKASRSSPYDFSGCGRCKIRGNKQ
jgi:hypothetical protein